jgi:hypothetical protein
MLLLGQRRRCGASEVQGLMEIEWIDRNLGLSECLSTLITTIGNCIQKEV